MDIYIGFAITILIAVLGYVFKINNTLVSLDTSFKEHVKVYNKFETDVKEDFDNLDKKIEVIESEVKELTYRMITLEKRNCPYTNETHETKRRH